jgi:hypothetical protein
LYPPTGKYACEDGVCATYKLRTFVISGVSTETKFEVSLLAVRTKQLHGLVYQLIREVKIPKKKKRCYHGRKPGREVSDAIEQCEYGLEEDYTWASDAYAYDPKVYNELQAIAELEKIELLGKMLIDPQLSDETLREILAEKDTAQETTAGGSSRTSSSSSFITISENDPDYLGDNENHTPTKQETDEGYESETIDPSKHSTPSTPSKAFIELLSHTSTSEISECRSKLERFYDDYEEMIYLSHDESFGLGTLGIPQVNVRKKILQVDRKHLRKMRRRKGKVGFVNLEIGRQWLDEVYCEGDGEVTGGKIVG